MLAMSTWPMLEQGSWHGGRKVWESSPRQYSLPNLALHSGGTSTDGSRKPVKGFCVKGSGVCLESNMLNAKRAMC